MERRDEFEWDHTTPNLCERLDEMANVPTEKRAIMRIQAMMTDDAEKAEFLHRVLPPDRQRSIEMMLDGDVNIGLMGIDYMVDLIKAHQYNNRAFPVCIWREFNGDSPATKHHRIGRQLGGELGDWMSTSICALAQHVLGEDADADEMTLRIAEYGARLLTDANVMDLIHVMNEVKIHATSGAPAFLVMVASSAGKLLQKSRLDDLLQMDSHGQMTHLDNLNTVSNAAYQMARFIDGTKKPTIIKLFARKVENMNGWHIQRITRDAKLDTPHGSLDDDAFDHVL